MKKYYFFILSAFILASCAHNQFKKHSSGLKYKFIIKNSDSERPQVGDIIALKMRYTDSNDSIIEESSFFKTQLKNPSHAGGCIEDAIAIMHKGDSAVFKINTQNFFNHSRGQSVPNELSKSEELTFYIKLYDIISSEEFAKQKRLAAESDKRNEEERLQQFISDNKITSEPTMSGLYFIELKKGTGSFPIPGKKVTVHYVGKFLNGEVFDSSYERNEPFEFYLGIGKVIQGWDEGVSKMKVGGKYQLIIPSYLAYGNEQVGSIPPNSTLIFNVELISCEQ